MAAGSNNIVTDGLVYYADAGNRRSYPGAGLIWTDLVNGNNGTLTNMDTGGFDSQKGGVIEFDGTNEYVEIGAYGVNSVLNWGSGNGTVGVWMKSDDHAGTLIAMGAAGSGGKRYLIQYDNDGNKISFAMDNDVTLKAANGSDTDGLKDDKWHYVVGMRIGQYIYLYVDGVLDATTDLGAGYGSVDYTSNGGLYMGGIWHVGDTVDHEWNGYLALAHIYNRALSADEVSQNYEALKPRFTPRIAKRGMNLNFDAGDPASYPGGTTWKDTANGLATVFNNMGVVNFNSSNGGCFDFDGTNEYMTAPYSPLFQSAIADQGTFAAWFNIDEAEADGADVPIWCGGKNGSKMIWAMGQFNSSKKMNFGAYLDGSWGDHTDTAVLSYDTWYYGVFTWDKANTEIKSYVNGALDDTETTSSVSITTSTTGWLGIGASLYSVSNGNTPNDYLNGFIGVLQLYDSVLSASEISDNYNKTKARFGH